VNNKQKTVIFKFLASIHDTCLQTKGIWNSNYRGKTIKTIKKLGKKKTEREKQNNAKTYNTIFFFYLCFMFVLRFYIILFLYFALNMVCCISWSGV
jgi:hypothetical protein